jgi:PknH-like extracellular domain
VTSQNASTKYTDAISDVSLANSVVTATVSDTSFFADVPSLRLTMTGAHALGVRVNCIVEVKVGVLGGAQGPSGARRNATDVANAILDRISAAS